MTDLVAAYYDSLIDKNNDPVHDLEPLKQYMNNWDGQIFIDKMNLSRDKSVLEIGVGTGRLAVQAAPLCGEFYGIDLSSKTIGRAKENLALYENTVLIHGDFLSFDFAKSFDVIYSSLTFMHINDKQSAIQRVADLLKKGGKFILSIDKNQDKYIDFGKSKIEVYPDSLDEIKSFIDEAKLTVSELCETKFAYVFICDKRIEPSVPN